MGAIRRLDTAGAKPSRESTGDVRAGAECMDLGGSICSRVTLPLGNSEEACYADECEIAPHAVPWIFSENQQKWRTRSTDRGLRHAREYRSRGVSA